MFNKMRIELDLPNVGEIEKKYLSDCIDSSFVSTFGPFVEQFEKEFAEFIGAERAVSVQSGTAALHIALVELGIGPGDEVIVPDITFAATVNPVIYVGATPVFVDVNPLSWNIDVQKIEEVITPRTKAILPVHVYGNPCDMNKIRELASKHNLFIIEDATESLGAKYTGQHTGTIGEIGCFSFNGNKLITTGGGGMVVTKDHARAEHIKFMVNQSRDAAKGYFHSEIGYNYRMTNLEASMGLAQMRRIEDFIAKKKTFAKIYAEILSDIPEISFPQVHDGAESVWWLSSLMLGGYDVVDFQLKLRERGIPTRRIFAPLHSYPYLKQFALKSYPCAEKIFQYGLNLPSSTLNTEESVIFAADTIRSML